MAGACGGVLLRQRHAFSFFFFSFFSFLARFSRLRASRASSSASRRRRFWSRRRSSAKGSESELSLSLPLLEAEDIYMYSRKGLLRGRPMALAHARFFTSGHGKYAARWAELRRKARARERQAAAPSQDEAEESDATVYS